MFATRETPNESKKANLERTKDGILPRRIARGALVPSNGAMSSMDLLRECMVARTRPVSFARYYAFLRLHSKHDKHAMRAVRPYICKTGSVLMMALLAILSLRRAPVQRWRKAAPARRDI